ncbi:MAG: elongation factor P [Kordiimonadaceae bacterium]|nr:elongation factor P [Kordiimonadaceae bacterium]MBT6032459.1 elongation factor P [Kordiimonadaceae bacterium]
MKVPGNTIRPGNVVEHQGGIWIAVKIAHTQPGKGGAYLQVELKNLLDGRKLNERFRSSEKVDKIRLEQNNNTFLFAADDMYTFMDAVSYEQIEISSEFLGDKALYLQDGMEVIVESYEGKPIGVELPKTVELTVMETEPAVKGQTQKSSNKPATMNNGMRVMVPTFINQDDVIIVYTEDGTYAERAK